MLIRNGCVQVQEVLNFGEVQVMGNIVVTGAAGFIGQHLVRRLLSRTSDMIVGVDNLHRGRWDGLLELVHQKPLRLIEGDVRDPGLLSNATRGAHIVFHLAAQSNVLGAVADIGYSFETNVVGTFNVLRAARVAGVRCVVFASSREVYGEPHALPVEENFPLAAKNAYGASKIAAEAYCRVFDSAEMRVVILRLANVYGPGDRDRVIPIFVERVKQGLPLVLYGGEQVIDFVPVDFVVEAIVRAADVRPAEPVNVGSGRGTALKDLARLLLKLDGSSVGWEIAPARPVEVTRFVANVERMRRRLGLEPPEDPLVQVPSLLAHGGRYRQPVSSHE
jgi:UDP-glucose 4-epimerase